MTMSASTTSFSNTLFGPSLSAVTIKVLMPQPSERLSSHRRLQAGHKPLDPSAGLRRRRAACAREHVLGVNERPRAVRALFARYGSIGRNAELSVSELIGEPVSRRRFANGLGSHVSVETVAGNGVTVRALRWRRVTKYAVFDFAKEQLAPALLAHALRDVLLRAAVEVTVHRPRGVRLVGLDTQENRPGARVSEITGTKLSRRPSRCHGVDKSSSEPGIREVKERDPGQEGPGPRTCTDRVVFHVRILPHRDFPRSAVTAGRGIP
jgi:hypothetical protein